MEITGFSDGIPQDVDETWTKEKNGRTYTFGKHRESAKHFAYFIQRDTNSEGFTGGVSTGFETDRDMTREEVEQRQQFVDFMNATR